MAVEMTWYRVKCDWCQQKVDMQGSKPILPFNWIEDDRKGIQFMEGSHFCGKRCVENFRAADQAVGELSKVLAARITNTASTLSDVSIKDFTLSLYHRGFLVKAEG